MIKAKNLIILGVILVLLIGAAAVLLLTNDKGAEDADSLSAAADSVEICRIEEDSISEVHAEVNGESFSLTRNGENWQVSGLPEVALKQLSVRTLLSSLSIITAEKQLDDPDRDISIYGLTEPQARYTIVFTDGTQKQLLLGNQDPVSQSYYFKTDDNDAIYMVYSTKGESLLRPLGYYRNTDLLTVDLEKLNFLSFSSGGCTVTLEQRTTGEGDAALSDWWMTEPYDIGSDDQRLTEDVLTKISEWKIENFIFEGTDNDAQYGLTPPYGTIVLRDNNGAQQTLLVGNAEGESRYVRTEGLNSVYTVSADSVDFLDIDPFRLINKFINLENIDNLDSVEIRSAAGAAHTLSVRREGEGENAVTTYLLDGAEVEERPFKQMYQSVIGLTADGLNTEPRGGAPQYTLIYRLLDGSTKTYGFYEFDERNYAVSGSDGTQLFLVLKKKLPDMFTDIETPPEEQ